MGKYDSDAPSFEQALKESEEKYRTLFEASLDGILLESLEGRIVELNDAACEMYGYSGEEMIGMNVSDLVPEKIREQLPQIIEEHLDAGGICVEAQGVRKDGTVFPTEVSTRMVELRGEKHVIVYVRDITSRKNEEAERALLRAELSQAQKFEALGMLASGVAHEINNPMQVIINYAQLLTSRMSRDSQEREFCEEITSESFRVAGIVRGLLSMARPQRETPRSESLEDIVNSTLLLFRSAQLYEDFDIRHQLSDDLPQILCHRQDIQQVLMNLLMNARHALNMRYEGRHTDKIIRVMADAKDISGKQFVRTTVEDKGPGIDVDMQARIFEPFFTTKPEGEGTGLGLSVSKHIILEHGGNLSVESVPGSFTRFHMDLPALS